MVPCCIWTSIAIWKLNSIISYHCHDTLNKITETIDIEDNYINVSPFFVKKNTNVNENITKINIPFFNYPYLRRTSYKFHIFSINIAIFNNGRLMSVY
jgi:hypothetical protein